MRRTPSPGLLMFVLWTAACVPARAEDPRSAWITDFTRSSSPASAHITSWTLRSPIQGVCRRMSACGGTATTPRTTAP